MGVHIFWHFLEMLREGIEDYECLWLARQGLERAPSRGGSAELVERGQKDMARAVDLATQQSDRTRIPRDPIPAGMDEARRIVNKLLEELADAKLVDQ